MPRCASSSALRAGCLDPHFHQDLFDTRASTVRKGFFVLRANRRQLTRKFICQHMQYASKSCTLETLETLETLKIFEGFFCPCFSLCQPKYISLVVTFTMAAGLQHHLHGYCRCQSAEHHGGLVQSAHDQRSRHKRHVRDLQFGARNSLFLYIRLFFLAEGNNKK